METFLALGLGYVVLSKVNDYFDSVNKAKQPKSQNKDKAVTDFEDYQRWDYVIDDKATGGTTYAELRAINDDSLRTPQDAWDKYGIPYIGDPIVYGNVLKQNYDENDEPLNLNAIPAKIHVSPAHFNFVDENN
jgi:hypothetical protein